MTKRSKEQWLSLFQQHQDSGLTASEFCKENHLCPKYFSQRKRQLGWIKKSGSGEPFVRFMAPKSTIAQPIQLNFGQSSLQLPANTSEVWLANFIKALHA